jgi:heme A synthase
MKGIYRGLGYVIAAEVAIQAAAMVYAVAGLGIWVENDGGVLDKAAFESEDTLFPEIVGFMIHGINGMMVIPALALIFLLVSFFAKIPGGVKWAGLVLLAVVLQVALGLFGHENAIFGALHGLNALLLFGLAVMAGKRVSSVTTTVERSDRELVTSSPRR